VRRSTVLLAALAGVALSIPASAPHIRPQPDGLDIPKSALGNGPRNIKGGNKFYEDRATKSRRRKLAKASKRRNR
jgi:hypothetical protein